MRAKPREVYALPMSHSRPERLGREPGPPGSSDLGTCASCGHFCHGVRMAECIHTRLQRGGPLLTGAPFLSHKLGGHVRNPGLRNRIRSH